MLYRPSEKTDIPAMARIRACDWGELEYWENRISRYLDGEFNPQLALAPRTCYVALEESSVVGFAAGHLTRRHACKGELQWINVIPERRGSGVAFQLFRLLAGWFVQHSAFRICVDVDPLNETARTFYTRNGAEKLNDHWLVWSDIRGVLGRQRS